MKIKESIQSKPIATYREVTLTGKRTYELYADRISVKGVVNFSYDFEETLMLEKFRADYVKLRVRPMVAWVFLCMSLLAGLACLMLIFEIPIQSSAIPGVLGILSGSSFIVAIASMRKIEYARFCSEEYTNALLSVARSGPQRLQFDSFISTLMSQIGHAKQLAQESRAAAV